MVTSQGEPCGADVSSGERRAAGCSAQMAARRAWPARLHFLLQPSRTRPAPPPRRRLCACQKVRLSFAPGAQQPGRRYALSVSTSNALGQGPTSQELFYTAATR